MSLRAAAGTLIHAPIERCWAALVDTEAYPTWNPFVPRVDRLDEHLHPGARLRLHVCWDDGSGTTAVERVVRFEPPDPTRAAFAYRFDGYLNRFGLLRCTREHVLASTQGGTHYRTFEVFEGLVAAFVPIAQIRRGFAAQTEAFRNHIETSHRVITRAAS